MISSKMKITKLYSGVEDQGTQLCLSSWIWGSLVPLLSWKGREDGPLASSHRPIVCTSTRLFVSRHWALKRFIHTNKQFTKYKKWPIKVKYVYFSILAGLQGLVRPSDDKSMEKREILIYTPGVRKHLFISKI